MSDLAAAARILSDLADALDQPGGRYYAASVRDLIHVLDDDTAAALLDAARRELAPDDEVLRVTARQLAEQVEALNAALVDQREPRVWLPGDTVPAGVWVQDLDGELWLSGLVVCDAGPYVEVRTPSESTMAAAVAAEQTRREAKP